MKWIVTGLTTLAIVCGVVSAPALTPYAEPPTAPRQSAPRAPLVNQTKLAPPSVTLTPEAPLATPTAPPERVVMVTDPREVPAVRHDVWAVLVEVFGPEHADCAALIAWRESRFRTDAVGALGEQGIFQVRAIYHGPVPHDLVSQVIQASRIHSQQGWRPWSTRGDC